MADITLQNINNFTADLSKRIIAEIEQTDTLLLISGGSLLSKVGLLLNVLVNSNGAKLANLHISLIDERWDANPYHPDSTWQQFTLLPIFNEVQSTKINLYPVLRAGLSLDETATSHDKLIKQFKQEVLVLFGIGEDGHTAGILPHPEKEFDFFNVDKVIGYDVSKHTESDDPYKYRITPGFKLLQNIGRNGYIQASGESKREALQLLLDNNEYNLHEFPAGILKSIPGLQLYTDLHFDR